MPETRTVRVRVEGRVQGVGYRAWTEAAAEALGLAGWVRNRRDGSVEAVFQGLPGDVAQMLDRCAEGPSAARVSRVEVASEDAGGFSGFEVLPTA